MQTLTFLFAFIAVLALIGVAAWLVRRFANNRLGANTQRGRMPRLAVIDAAAVDGRRRLVLVRRDNVEHLLMIGGPSDIVVEPNIVRAMPNRDQMAQRPAVGEQPPRIAPLPDAAWNEEAARADSRSTDDHVEPQMPEPPPQVEVWEAAPIPEEQRRNLVGLIPPDQRPRVIMRWGNTSELLVSGLLDGGDEIAQHASLIDSPLDRGHVILFSNNPFWRGQTSGSYSLVFNTILNFDNLNAGRKLDEK